MGLFDKIFQKSPLEDVTVKKYYEIIYWMERNYGWGGKESTDKNSRARRYIELVIGELCDEEKFKSAVELINAPKIYTPKNKTQVQQFLLDDRINYVCPANYKENSYLDRIVKLIIKSTCLVSELSELEEKQTAVAEAKLLNKE